MDILTLAKLPLNTLALVLGFWALSKLWEVAAKRFDTQSEHLELHNRLQVHAAYLDATMAEAQAALFQILSRCRQIFEEVQEEEPAPKPRAGFETMLFGGNQTAAIKPAGNLDTDKAKKIVGLSDFTVTEGTLDAKEVVSKLHTLDPETGGLALVLIEAVPMVSALLDKANGFDDTSDGAIGYVATLLSAQNAVLTATVSARAIHDLDFRHRLQAEIGGKSGTAAAQAYYAFVCAEIGGFAHLFDWKETADGEEIGLVPLEINPETAPSLRVAKFEAANLAPRAASRQPYVWPVLFGAVLIGVVAMPQVYAWLRPTPAASVTCTAKFGPDGLKEVSCPAKGASADAVLKALGVSK